MIRTSDLLKGFGLLAVVSPVATVMGYWFDPPAKRSEFDWSVHLFADAITMLATFGVFFAIFSQLKRKSRMPLGIWAALLVCLVLYPVWAVFTRWFGEAAFGFVQNTSAPAFIAFSACAALFLPGNRSIQPTTKVPQG